MSNEDSGVWSCTTPASLGALRVLSRRDDTEILILHGDGREAEVGERLACVEWFDTIEIARAVSHFCSARLMSIPSFHPNAEGWHPFPAASLRTLVADAKNNLNVTFFAPVASPKPVAQHQAWTKKRIARLAFLAGQGFTAKSIAEDPLIRSTPHAVYRAAYRHEISLAEIPPGQIPLRLPASAIAYFERAAMRDQVTRDALIRRILIGIATAPERAVA